MGNMMKTPIPKKSKKKTTKTSKNTVKAASLGEDDLQKIEEMIQKHFKNKQGDISIRHLWSIEDVHRFRVNFWIKKESPNSCFGGPHSISDSAFIVVRKTAKRIKIEELQ